MMISKDEVDKSRGAEPGKHRSIVILGERGITHDDRDRKSRGRAGGLKDEEDTNG